MIILPKYQTTLLAAALSSALLTACNDSNGGNNSELASDTNQANAYELMMVALGAEQGGTNATGFTTDAQLSFHVEGRAYEFQEQPEPVANLMADFSYDIAGSLDGQLLKQTWQIDTEYAFDIDLNFTEVISGQQGVVIDGPNSFASYAFGAFGVPADAMNAAKLATRQKTWFMSSPWAIVAAISEDMASEETPEHSDNPYELITEFQGHKVSLQLDEKTYLPLFATTQEFDPLLGDVLYRVDYDNWQFVGNTIYPLQISHSLDGHLIREEAVTGVEFSALAREDFDFNGISPNAPDSQTAGKGYQASQFYLRGMMMGFPFDSGDETQVQSDFIDSENKVLRLMGIEHYNYAFLIDDKVYLYDAPYTNTRQQAVLAEVQAKFPGKEIAGVILSHNHYDHAGGWRGALAQGGALYVGAGSADFYQQLLNRPHTLQPNPLAEREPVEILGVEGKLTLGQGAETLELYSVSQGHAEEGDMLILYRRQDKTLFFADLFNSGFGMLQNFFPELAPTIKGRAQMLVDFVNLHDLDVVRVAPLHGDVVNDTSYESVKAAAAF